MNGQPKTCRRDADMPVVCFGERADLGEDERWLGCQRLSRRPDFRRCEFYRGAAPAREKAAEPARPAKPRRRAAVEKVRKVMDAETARYFWTQFYRARRARGLTLEALAEKANISRPTLSKFNRPKWTTARKIADALGLPLEELTRRPSEYGRAGLDDPPAPARKKAAEPAKAAKPAEPATEPPGGQPETPTGQDLTESRIDRARAEINRLRGAFGDWRMLVIDVGCLPGLEEAIARAAAESGMSLQGWARWALGEKAGWRPEKTDR